MSIQYETAAPTSSSNRQCTVYDVPPTAAGVAGPQTVYVPQDIGAGRAILAAAVVVSQQPVASVQVTGARASLFRAVMSNASTLSVFVAADGLLPDLGTSAAQVDIVLSDARVACRRSAVLTEVGPCTSSFRLTVFTTSLTCPESKVHVLSDGAVSVSAEVGAPAPNAALAALSYTLSNTSLFNQLQDFALGTTEVRRADLIDVYASQPLFPHQLPCKP